MNERLGGGPLLRQLDERLRKETGVPVHLADEPFRCLAIGSGRCLEAINQYRGALSSA
jgi:rod shape-determining protein MreB